MKTDRRKFIQTMGSGAAGLSLGAGVLSVASCTTDSNKKNEDDGQIIFIGDNIAVAETT